MGNAKKIRDTYSSKGIVFVYLSIDRTKTEWETASKEENLSVLPHNYILVNADSSAFLRSINLSAIPRYLLFDRAGKLVHANAPEPDSEELKQLLEVYLREEEE